jgi:glycine cleavage system H protein
MIPEGLKYTKEHEWIEVKGNRARLGITHYAQDELGDIVFVDLPKAGGLVRAGQTVSEVESTKTTSSIYSPVSGSIVAVNEPLRTQPEIINQDPYGQGWIVEIELSNPKEPDGLMNAKGYEAYLKSLEGK